VQLYPFQNCSCCLIHEKNKLKAQIPGLNGWFYLTTPVLSFCHFLIKKNYQKLATLNTFLHPSNLFFRKNRKVPPKNIFYDSKFSFKDKNNFPK
jgi:hypothetical protein